VFAVDVKPQIRCQNAATRARRGVPIIPIGQCCAHGLRRSQDEKTSVAELTSAVGLRIDLSIKASSFVVVYQLWMVIF
jgi:hypothetical protein